MKQLSAGGDRTAKGQRCTDEGFTEAAIDGDVAVVSSQAKKR